MLRAAKEIALDIQPHNIYKMSYLLERLLNDFCKLEKSGLVCLNAYFKIKNFYSYFLSLPIESDRMAQYREEIRFLVDLANKRKEVTCISMLFFF